MTAQFKKEINIKFWYEFTDALEALNFDDREQLEDDAKERIFSQIKEGYTSGELCTSINDDEFYGWWEYSIKNSD